MSRRAKNPTGGSSSSRRDAVAVSRETAPRAPAVAQQVFGDGVDLIGAYADLLAGPGVERGLLGPREVSRLWERHLLNCGMLGPLLGSGVTACDIGSGAGLPGIVVAVVRPDVQVTLLEPLLRRATFLTEVVERLELENAVVVRERAEEHDGVYDAVMARAVAPLSRLARLALPLCRPGGVVFAIKGERAAAELAEAEEQLVRLGTASRTVERYGEDLLETPMTVVRITAGSIP